MEAVDRQELPADQGQQDDPLDQQDDALGQPVEHLQRAARDVDTGDEEGRDDDGQRVVAGHHGDDDATERRVQGDVLAQPVFGAGDDQPARHAGQGAGEQDEEGHRRRDRQAQGPGRARIVADHPAVEAEARPADQHRDKPGCGQRHDQAGMHVAEPELRQSGCLVDDRRDREVAPRIAHRSEQQVLQQQIGDARQQQRDDDLADLEGEAQDQRDGDPGQTRDGGGGQHERRSHLRSANLPQGDRGPGDGAQNDLPLDPDVPETMGQRDRGGQAEEDHRRRHGQGLRQTRAGEEDLDHGLLEQGSRRDARRDQDDRREAEAGADRSGKDQRLPRR